MIEEGLRWAGERLLLLSTCCHVLFSPSQILRRAKRESELDREEVVFHITPPLSSFLPFSSSASKSLPINLP